VSKNQIKKILFLFAIISLLTIIIALLIALYNIFETNSMYIFNPINKVNESFLSYHRLSKNVGFHAVYLGIYITFANVIFVERLLTSNNKLHKTLYLLAIIVISISIVLLNSFSVMTSYGLILIVLLLVNRKRINFISRAFITIIGIVIFVFGIKTFYNKAESYNQQYLNYSFSDDINNKNWNSLNIRLAKWECALEVANQYSPFGTGVGCQQIQLNKKYIEKDFKIAYDKKYTTHNQYLHSFVQLGMMGLICILLLYFFGLRDSLKNNNVVFLSLMILVIVTSLTENVLTMNKGIVFFTLFMSMLSKTQTVTKLKGIK